jgi:hypothetical protein
LSAIAGESAKHRALDTVGMDEDEVMAVRPEKRRQGCKTSYRLDEAAGQMRANR